MIKAVIFDMDGTALDSMRGSSENVERYLTHLGLDLNHPRIQELLDKSWFIDADDINDVYGTDYCNKAIRDGYIETHYGMYDGGYALTPGFVELLDYFDEVGIKYGIATATRIQGAESAMKSHGLYDRFSVITTEGRVGKTKQFPAIYEYAAKKMNATNEETLVCEDALYAITTAHQAGFRTAGIQDPFFASDHAAIQEIGDVFVKDFYELLELFKAGTFKK